MQSFMVMMVPLKIALQLRNNYQQPGRLYFLFRRSKFFDFSAYYIVVSTRANSSKNFPVSTSLRRYMDPQNIRRYRFNTLMFISIAMKYHLLLKFVSLVVLTILITNVIATSILSGFDQVAMKYASAQQGQVRCTNGSLVPSPTECPSTDVCPSPSGPNTVAYCSLREPAKSSPTESNIQEKQEVAIATDKESYHPGEPVKIIIQNVGNQPLRVSGLNYNLTIINLANNQSYPLVHGKTSILAVDSGASANAIWDQLDDKGKQVSAGNYTVLAILDSLPVNTTFTISRQ
jgi:hypothetical protein